jgi:hypothetical protein
MSNFTDTEEILDGPPPLGNVRLLAHPGGTHLLPYLRKAIRSANVNIEGSRVCSTSA